MRTKAILLMSVFVLGLGLSTQAQVIIQANGVVTAGRLPSGAWAGVQAGDPAYMVFVVPERGTVLAPGQAEGYLILTESFVMAINDRAVGLGESLVPPAAFVSNDYPRADAFVMSPDVIRLSEPGYGLQFELHDSSGAVWNSPLVICIPGIYGAQQFDDREWSVLFGGGGLSLSVTELIIYPLPEPPNCAG